MKKLLATLAAIFVGFIGTPTTAQAEEQGYSGFGTPVRSYYQNPRSSHRGFTHTSPHFSTRRSFSHNRGVHFSRGIHLNRGFYYNRSAYYSRGRSFNRRYSSNRGYSNRKYYSGGSRYTRGHSSRATYSRSRTRR